MKRRRRYRVRLKIRIKNFFYTIYLFFNRPFRRHKNKKLCERYPFLKHHPDWDYGIPADYKYDRTFLDDMPKAWKKDFGIQMCEEIRNELIRCSTPETDWLNEYKVSQVKEKWGTLRWYDDGSPIGSTIDDIVSKYEDRSGMICICCGKPAMYETSGWVSYQCEKCFRKHELSRKMSDAEKARTLIKAKLYSDNIPYRTRYNEDGTKTRIDSPYLEEMKKQWPDKRPDTFDIDVNVKKI